MDHAVRPHQPGRHRPMRRHPGQRVAGHEHRWQLVAPAEQLASSVLDALPLLVTVVNADCQVVTVNARWLSHQPPVHPPRRGEPLTAAYTRIGQPVGVEPAACAAAVHAVARGQSAGYQVLLASTPEPAGQPRWFQLNVNPLRGGRGGAVASLVETTEQVAFERRLAHQATHDPLTGLVNRLVLVDRLEQALILARQSGGLVGVGFVDLDRFKQVNDEYGHAAGDRVLTEVGRALASTVRRRDTVARLGGDEFVLVLQDATPEGLERVTGQIRAALRLIRSPGAAQQASVGFVLSDGHARAEELLDRADAAMFTAKRDGSGHAIAHRTGQDRG